MVALVVTAVGVALLLPVLRRNQLLDVPNARSSHVTPVPRGGGIAVVVGLLSACGVTFAQHGGVPVGILLGTVIMAGVGWVDDLRNLSSSIRLVAQIVVGTALGVWLLAVSDTAGWPPPFFVPVVGMAFAAYVNAFNFMDGINGISSLNALVAGGWFAWVGNEHGVAYLAALGLAASGAAVGFLPWNAPRAHIFLGDVGSYSFGAAIAGLAALAWAQGLDLLVSCAPLLVYLADTGWALGKRLWRHEALAEAHRDHVYQRLVDMGWSHTFTSLIAATAALSICGMTHYGREFPGVAWGGVVILLVGYLSLPALVRTLGRREAAR